jgi:glutaredoxin-dependent peroxiredoxin
MARTVGDRAPDWTLAAAIHNAVGEVSLTSLLEGKAGLVLTSYPLDFTGGCTNQMTQFRDAYEDFRSIAVEVVSVSVDSPHSHLVWARLLEIPFPMVSDFNRDLCRAYGILGPGSPRLRDTATRSAFVIDPSHVIRYVWQKDDGLPPVSEVLSAAQSISPE